MNLRLLLAQFTKRPWLLTMLLWMALVVPAQGAVQLRVAVEKGVDAVLFGSYGWQHEAPEHLPRCKDWPAVLEFFDDKS